MNYIDFGSRCRSALNPVIETLKKTGFFHIFGSGTLVQLVGFLSSIIVVRIVTKDEYGLFTYAANIYSIVMIISGLGSSETMLQIASENFRNEQKKRLIYQFALTFGIVANAVFSLIVVIVGFVYPFGVSGAQVLILMYAFLPVLQYLNAYQTMYLRVERRNREYSFVNLLFSVLQLIFSVIGALAFGPQGFILAQYASVVVIVAVAIKLYDIPLSFGLRQYPKNERREFIKYCLIISVGNGFSQLKSLVSAFILGVLIPNAAIIASYNVAIKIPTALLFIPSAICVYLYPHFAEHIDDGSWCLRNFFRSMVGVFCINLIVSVVAVLLAEPLIVIAFGSEYQDSVGVFIIMVVNYLIAGTFNTLPGNLLAAQRKFSFNLIVNIATGIMSIVLNIAFIMVVGGAEGAALAVLASSVLSGCCYTFGLISVYKRKVSARPSQRAH